MCARTKVTQAATSPGSHAPDERNSPGSHARACRRPTPDKHTRESSRHAATHVETERRYARPLLAGLFTLRVFRFAMPGHYWPGCYHAMMREYPPAGLLITWTTYGSWLHGDPRGAYDRKGEVHESHYMAPNARFERLRRSQLKHAPIVLDAAMRKAVRLAIEECCAFRGWPLWAVHVRTNHVHVAMPPCADGKQIVHNLKAHATRRLHEVGLIAHGVSAWTSGGSVSKLYSSEAVSKAIDYVRNRQGESLPEADPPQQPGQSCPR